MHPIGCIFCCAENNIVAIFLQVLYKSFCGSKRNIEIEDSAFIEKGKMFGQCWAVVHFCGQDEYAILWIST